MTLRNSLAGLATVISVVAVGLATRSQAFTYVDLDGRTLRLLIQGGGPVTVIFENGLGPPLEMWGKVQPAVGRFARTVTYDRAGVGLSDEGATPRDGRQIAAELHRALQIANIQPPYILVGASLGGPYTRIFAGMYPDDVNGLVLVDPTPDSEEVEGAQSPEANALPDTLNQARASRLRPGVPVVLIRAEGPQEIPFTTPAVRTTRLGQEADVALESQELKAWIAGIPGGRLIVTHDSGHNVPIEQTNLVVETIRHIIELSGVRPS